MIQMRIFSGCRHPDIRSINLKKILEESQNYQYILSLLAIWNLKGKSMFVETDKILRG
ncbi:MAG: hypothetical protein M1393_04505 [Candidatus Thermoplasmatota archaeon]|nr:hypothetical protein [Candidatus Thermoplasmatota archaeon]MDA8143310.1 hypothetical protein [Thermoplasmatales archaeon]